MHLQIRPHHLATSKPAVHVPHSRPIKRSFRYQVHLIQAIPTINATNSSPKNYQPTWANSRVILPTNIGPITLNWASCHPKNRIVLKFVRAGATTQRLRARLRSLKRLNVWANALRTWTLSERRLFFVNRLEETWLWQNDQVNVGWEISYVIGCLKRVRKNWENHDYQAWLRGLS